MIQDVSSSLLISTDQRNQERRGTDVKKNRRKSGCVRANLFIILTFVGIIVGFVIGLSVRLANPGDTALLWIGMPGELYLRMLKALILPLIVCCVIDATSHTDLGSNLRISVVSFVYIISTNIIGGVLGMLICLVIKPGTDVESSNAKKSPSTNLKTMDIFADFIRNLIPPNLVGATIQQSQTKYSVNNVVSLVSVSGVMVNVTSEEIKKSIGWIPGTNVLGLIICCAALGVAASMSGDKGRPFLGFINSCSAIIFTLFDYIKWATPVGVASLIARALAGIDDLNSAFQSMGMFILALTVCNVALQLLVYPLIYLVFTRKSPHIFLASLVKPWLITFGPPATALALPELIRVNRKVHSIDTRISSSVLPVSMTINRDGSGNFITVTCLFLIQFAGMTLDAETVIIVGILSILSSMAVPPVPSGSVVIVLIILGSLGIPPVNIGLVLGTEFYSDRIRSTTNCASHMLTTIVTWQICKDFLRRKDMEALDKSDICEELVSVDDIRSVQTGWKTQEEENQVKPLMTNSV